MAVTTSSASNPLVTTVVTDTTADVTVEIVAAGNQTLYAVEMTNPNTGEAAYAHVFHTASGAAVTDQHEHQFYCPAASTVYYYMPAGLETATGLQFYCSTSAGGGNQATSPTEGVTIKFGFTAR